MTFETSIWKSAHCLRLVRYLFGDEKPEKNKFKHRYQVSKIFVKKGLSLAFLKKNRTFNVMSEKSNTFAFELSWASQSKLTNSPLTTSSFRLFFCRKFFFARSAKKASEASLAPQASHQPPKAASVRVLSKNYHVQNHIIQEIFKISYFWQNSHF